jgi:hypothetical protein
MLASLLGLNLLAARCGTIPFAETFATPAIASLDEAGGQVVRAAVAAHELFENKEDGGTLIERVELKRDGMQITLNLRALLSVDRFPTGATNLRMTRLVPLQMKQRGVETRLVLPSEVQPSRSDPALLRAVAPRLSVVRRTGGRNGFINLADRRTRRSQRQLRSPHGTARPARPSDRRVHLRSAPRRLPLSRASQDSGRRSDRVGRTAAAAGGLETAALLIALLSSNDPLAATIGVRLEFNRQRDAVAD